MLVPQIVGPPPESPIEQRLQDVLALHLDTSNTLFTQFECVTPWTTFWIDFVVETPTGRIGFECDGRDYHDSYRDEVRDSLILGTHCVDTIYRFPGSHVTFAVHDLLFIATLYDPAVFSERGRKVLHSQACDSIREHDPDGYGGFIYNRRLERGDPPTPLLPHNFTMSRESRFYPKHKKPYWTEVYSHALQHRQMSFVDYLALRRSALESMF